jgi:hypothetical protein
MKGWGAVIRAQGIVYRGGSRSPDNFTPRHGKDTVGRPGQAPGLSTFENIELAAEPGEKAQVIDLSRLRPPLVGFLDDASLKGTPGHVAIAPVDATGDVDQELLEEWARTRGTDSPHRLTEMILAAVVRTNVRRPK